MDNPDSLKVLCDLMSRKTDTEFTPDDFTRLGQDILNLEREFNNRAGFTKNDDRLPDFFKKEPVGPHNVVCDISDEELATINYGS